MDRIGWDALADAAPWRWREASDKPTQAISVVDERGDDGHVNEIVWGNVAVVRDVTPIDVVAPPPWSRYCVRDASMRDVVEQAVPVEDLGEEEME